MGVFDVNGNKIDSATFISVKDYGAVGNGEDDDYLAIQNAINACNSNGGGILFFPQGTYLIKTIVRYYSNQSFVFENGARILRGNSSINAMFLPYLESSITEYNGVHDVEFTGGIIDGNAEFTNTCTLIGTRHGLNIIFRNMSFVNSYGSWHLVEINSSKNVLIESCKFDGVNKNNLGESLQIEGASGSFPWSNVGQSDSTESKNVEIKNCYFFNSKSSRCIGNHSSSGANEIRIHDNVFYNCGNSSYYAIGFTTANNVDIYNNTFDSCTYCIDSLNSSCTIHDNRFVGVTIAIESNVEASAYNNMINGTFTA